MKQENVHQAGGRTAAGRRPLLLAGLTTRSRLPAAPADERRLRAVGLLHVIIGQKESRSGC